MTYRFEQIPKAMSRTRVILSLLLVALLVSPALARKWTSRSGNFSVDAELIEVDEEQAVLKRDDNGKLVRVPIAQLSLADVLYIREVKKAAKPTDTPEPSALDTDQQPAAVSRATKRKPTSSANRKSHARLDEGLQVMKAGGAASDVGLPPLSKPDRTAIASRKKDGETAPYAAVKWPAQNPPAPFTNLDLAESLLNVKHTFVAAKQPHLILIDGELIPSDPSAHHANGNRVVSIADVYDLNLRKRLSRFESFVPRRLADFSPSGKMALFIEGTEQRRLDVFELQSGRHVVAFKPHNETSDPKGLVPLQAGFADDEHIWTLNPKGELVVWCLEGCRAVSATEVGTISHAFVDRSGQYLATGWVDGVQILETMSGRSCAALPLPIDDRSRGTSLAYAY